MGKTTFSLENVIVLLHLYIVTAIMTLFYTLLFSFITSSIFATMADGSWRRPAVIAMMMTMTNEVMALLTMTNGSIVPSTFATMADSISHPSWHCQSGPSVTWLALVNLQAISN